MAANIRNKTDLIVLHHSGVATYKQSMSSLLAFCRSQYSNGIGYHYLIDTNGDLYVGRDIERVGAHAVGFNSRSIGICLRGNFEEEQPSEQQLSRVIALIKELRLRYPFAKIEYHKNLNATACPGAKFPYDTFNAINTVTYLSIYEFQYAAALDGFKFSKYGIDGKYGNETESIMKKAVIKKGSKRKNLVKIIQRYVGANVDGIFGSKTLTAVRKYQSSQGLSVDGIVGVKTWKKMTGVV